MSIGFTLEIRKAELADSELLSYTGAEMFYETFADDNTVDDMLQYLNENFTPECLREKISDPVRAFYIAYSNDEVVGYLQILPVSEHEHFPGQTGLCIERIYVYKKFQDKKAGAALMQYAVDLARRNTSWYIWLSVWEENIRAIAFYERWGFIPFGSVIFMLGTDPQTDILMYKPL